MHIRYIQEFLLTCMYVCMMHVLVHCYPSLTKSKLDLCSQVARDCNINHVLESLFNMREEYRQSMSRAENVSERFIRIEEKRREVFVFTQNINKSTSDRSNATHWDSNLATYVKQQPLIISCLYINISKL